MPSDAYASVVRGGLKLKGSAGITKKKKKKSKERDGEVGEGKKDALQKALEDEDSALSKVKGKRKAEEGGDAEGQLVEEGDRELEERGNDGKTASERAYEEMRRKRVYIPIPVLKSRKREAGTDIEGSYTSDCRKKELRRIRRRWRS
jgi:protein FAM32A